MKYRITWYGRNGQLVEKIVCYSKIAEIISEATIFGGRDFFIEQV